MLLEEGLFAAVHVINRGLLPAALGVLIEWSQTTKGMGVYPNADGHECISEAIWETDTIDPGANICQ